MTKKKDNGSAVTQQEFREYAHYFVTLYTRERRPLFKKFPVLRRLTERRWRSLMDVYPHVGSDEYSMKTNAFHAIVRVRRVELRDDSPELPEGFLDSLKDDALLLPAQVLEHTLDFFRATTAHEWGKYLEADKQKVEPEVKTDEIPNFWKGDYRVTPIRDQEELDEMREYIITNILKGGMY